MHGYRLVFEVQQCHFRYVAPKLIPPIALGEDSVTKGTRIVAAFFGVTNFEDQFHATKIPDPPNGYSRPWAEGDNNVVTVSYEF